MAFMPLFFVTPASATEMTLEDAQAALIVAQQEVVDATTAKQAADDAVATASAEVSRTLEERNATATTISGTTTTASSNVVQNGEFNDASAWSGIAMYQDYMYNNYYAAVVKDGVLKGSYSSGNFYMQQGTFESPVRNVFFSVDVLNNDNQRNDTAYDYYRIEFRTYAADGTRLNYFNFQYGGAFHDWITRSATYTLAQNAVRWDVGFRLADGGYWNGNYGPAIDNVKVIVQTTTTTPDQTVYDAEKELAYQAAVNEYNVALSNQQSANNRLSLALAEVERLQALIVALTPPWWQIQFDENQTVTIGAPEGFVFGIPVAKYETPDGSCSLDVSSTVSAFITGNTTASFVANNANFTDPCPGWGKVLRLSTPIEAVAVPTPEPTPEPTPTPTATPETQPTVDPAPQPTETAQPPVPSPSPEPFPTVLPEPTPEPTLTPEPEETAEPQPTPGPTLTPEPEPTLEPKPEISETPKPLPSPEPPIEPEPQPSLPEEPEEIVSELLNVDPENLTAAQVEQLVEAALETFETAEPGSEEYQQALEALAVAAEADDPELPQELAAIPLIGDVAGAALELFNNVGNIGADMSPQVREQAEKTIIASVIAAQAAIGAVQAATSAASAAASTASSGSTRRN